MAVGSGDTQLLKDLIDGGLDVDAAADDGETVLQQAIRAKDLAIVRLLVEAGANVNGTGAHGETVLQRAVLVGDTNIVRLLLDAGADIERTPSLIIDALGNPELLHLLIKEGADVNARSRSGDSVLFEAIRSGETESVKILVDSRAVLGSHANSVDSLLEVAVSSSTPEMARLFITLGGDVNSAGSRGNPLMFTAIESSHTGMVRLLLEAGADPNTMTVYSGTYNNHEYSIYGSSSLLSAIMIPIRHGIRYEAETVAEDEENRLPTVQLLLDAGVDPGAANGSDYSICEFVRYHHMADRLVYRRVQIVLLYHCLDSRDKKINQRFRRSH